MNIIVYIASPYTKGVLGDSARMETKKCSVCKIEKPLSEFYKDLRALDGKASECKKCHNEETIKWRIEHPEKSREIAINIYRNYSSEKKRDIWLKNYGINSMQYREILKSQDGCCAICGKMQKENFHVDHNHSTGKVRGLLCGNCNRALGYMNENVEALKSAINYLEKNKQ